MTDPTPDRPLVTFALFAYNQEQYIREAVEGAFSQTYEPLEIILSDDCSSDRTYEIMQEMAAAYEGPHEVRVRRNEVNDGLVSHINVVAKEIRGEIAVFAAGDDVSHPDRVSLHCNAYQADPSLRALFSRSIVLEGVTKTPDNSVAKRSIRIRRISAVEHLLGGGGVGLGATYSYHSSVLKWPGLIPRKVKHEDRFLPFRAAVMGSVGRIEKDLISYREYVGPSRKRTLALFDSEHLAALAKEIHIIHQKGLLGFYRHIVMLCTLLIVKFFLYLENTVTFLPNLFKRCIRQSFIFPIKFIARLFSRFEVSVIVPVTAMLGNQKTSWCDKVDELDYRMRPIKVSRIGRANITRSGGIFRGRIPVLSSYYAYPRVKMRAFLIAAAQLLLHKRVLLSENKRYASGHNIWSGGYFHWVTEALPRLNEALSYDPDVIPLIPRQEKLSAVQKSSVIMLGAREQVIIDNGTFVSARSYVLASNPMRKAEFDPVALRKMRSNILGRLKPDDQRALRRVYISRRKARGRVVRNEAEVERTLALYGFESICFEDMTFRDQIELMRSTEFMISIHGAGLTNIAFMPEAGNVIEICADPDVIKNFASVRRSWKASPTYGRLSAILGHHYSILFCSLGHMDNAMVDLTVDTVALEELVQIAIAS